MYYDILIIGTGIAGCSAAHFLADKGYSVLLVTKEDSPSITNTFYAQGGIIGKAEGDSSDALAKDILNTGCGISNPVTVNILSTEGPDLVKNYLFKELNVPFTLLKGKPDCTAEGAHSFRRIYHSADYTGKAIQEKMLENAKKHKRIDILTSHIAIDLITNTHHSKDPVERYRDTTCFGAYFFDIHNNKVIKVLSDRTILATGGIGYIFLHTTNPASATGDGIAMAYRAGVPIINSEYVQFHPTTLYLSGIPERFLISESVRGEGAKLINKYGTPFMEKYHELKDLAPRDIVSRAIFNEMLETDSHSVFLDLASLKKTIDIKTRFPQIFDKCKEFGINILEQPIPVVPSAHYFCGGIKVDLDGRTPIKHLFAAGECACTGIHGANRLASTSLLEGLLWGKRSANHIISRFTKTDKSRFEFIPNWKEPELTESDPVLINNDIKTIRTLMWNYVGIVRTSKRLHRANRELTDMSQTIEEFYREATLSKQMIELRNMVTTARIIAHASNRNKKSLGCHFVE